MLHLKSKPKEIEYYIQQVEMLSMNTEEADKISKILALKDLIADSSIKELIEEDLKDESWLEATNILINTCNKRQVKSKILQEHVQQCKNFMVFRYLEDKLLYVKEIRVSKNPWAFTEIDLQGKETPWVNFKFGKCFEESDFPSILDNSFEDGQFIINHECLQTNKANIYTEEIFEDLDFLIKKKKMLVEV